MNITQKFGNIKTNNIIKFLIIRLSSIGDIVLATPVINAIKEQFPQSVIHFAVMEQFSNIIENHPYIDKIILYNKLLNKNEINNNKLQLINDYGKYDYIIDLQNNRRSKYFRKYLGNQIYKIEKRRLYKLMLVHLKKLVSPPIHCTINYLNSIKEIVSKDIINNNLYNQYVNTNQNIDLYDKHLSIETIQNNNKLNISISEIINSIKYFDPSKRNLIIAPGAAHFTKRFPLNKFLEIINSVSNCNIILIGSGNYDKITCEAIIEKSNKKIINLCSVLSLSQTAKIISQGNVILCNDSGVMHIAAALSIPIIAVFGSSVKELGFTPLSKNYTIIENTNLKCRPCSHIGRKKCPYKHFNCMQKIDSSNIIAQINKFI